MENGNGVAYNSGNEIHFNAGYLAGVSGDIKREFTGVVIHEVVHSWQWNGGGRASGGLIEEIADFLSMKTGRGDRWDQGYDGFFFFFFKGYDVTARFLDHCKDLRNCFVADL
ncbi:unnamed protein product, partial [Arabidopsis halleri]